MRRVGHASVGDETPSALPGWVPGWGGCAGTKAGQRGQPVHAQKAASSSTGPRCLALQTLTQVLAGRVQLGRSAQPSCVGQDLPIPYPYPPPGCPAARHDRPTWNADTRHPGTFRGEVCPQATNLPAPPESGCPKVWRLGRANPLQAWRGMERGKPCAVLPGADGTEHVFYPTRDH